VPATHYYETVLVSRHATFSARVVSLPAMAWPGQALRWIQFVDEAGLEPLDRVEPESLPGALREIVGPLDIAEEEWRDFLNQLLDEPIVPVEQSPAVAASLGALASTAGGVLLLGGPAGPLVGLIVYGTVHILISFTSGVAKGVEKGAEEATSEFVSAWLRRALPMPRRDRSGDDTSSE
jgi:hypothetical protein